MPVVCSEHILTTIVLLQVHKSLRSVVLRGAISQETGLGSFCAKPTLLLIRTSKAVDIAIFLVGYWLNREQLEVELGADQKLCLESLLGYVCQILFMVMYGLN